MVKVSVVIPVYNQEKYIEKCLKNICAQTLKDIEIVCVNDCSSDNSLSILKRCSANDRRIKVISFKENHGSGPARNAGIRKAKGEFIAFMDADDFYPENDVLEVLYNTAIEKKADICGGNVRLVNEKDYILRSNIKDGQKNFTGEGYINIYEWQWCYGYWRFIYSKKMMMDKGERFKNYRRYQDPPFMLKAMLDSGSIYGINKEVYCYRVFHKEIKWNLRMVYDKLKATDEVLEMCDNYGLQELKEIVINLNVKFKKKVLSIIPKIIIYTISDMIKHRSYFK